MRTSDHNAGGNLAMDQYPSRGGGGGGGGGEERVAILLVASCKRKQSRCN